MEKYLNRFYDVIDKIGKHNFILIIFIFVALLSTGLYQTFSLYTESEGLSFINNIKTYSFILRNNGETNSVVIASNSSKNIDITITNDSQANLNYKLYSSIESDTITNVFLGYSMLSKYLPEGIIPKSTSYVVTLEVYNSSSEDIVIDFGLKYGFENGGDLILDDGSYEIKPLTFIKSLYNSWNGNFHCFRHGDYRNKIENVSFVDIDEISETVSIDNAVESWDISKFSSTNASVVADASVFAWVIKNNTTNNGDSDYYDLYIGAKDTIYVESLYAFFSQMNDLRSIDFSNLDTSFTKDMSFLFRECINLNSLDLSGFDTSKVTNMWSIFGGCLTLTTLDLSGFDTSNVTNMHSMFFNCNSLIELDLSSFDITNVTDMGQMFQICNSLRRLDLSNLNTSNVIDMEMMFAQCYSLTELIFGENFKTNNVANMGSMFYRCDSLTELDLSIFDTSNVTDMAYMFGLCTSLRELDLSSFDTSNVINYTGMFMDCHNLSTSIIIRNNTVEVPIYNDMFKNAAISNNAQIVVYYIDDTQSLVNGMVATKTNLSNVVVNCFVNSLLSNMAPGSYVRYVGNNGCDTTNVNGWNSCSGKNANYVNNTNMGFCDQSTNKFYVNGWRIGYIEDGSVHLVAAGSTDCLCTNSDETTDGNSCSSYFDADNLYKHFNNLDNISLKYCNTDYAKGGICDNTTAWTIDANDFEKITGSPLNDNSCYLVSNSTECGYNNDLIDNGGVYWFKTVYLTKPHGAFVWKPYEDSRNVGIFNSSGAFGIRPVLALDPSVIVISGTGTYENPYIISNE